MLSYRIELFLIIYVELWKYGGIKITGWPVSKVSVEVAVHRALTGGDKCNCISRRREHQTFATFAKVARLYEIFVVRPFCERKRRE